MASTLSPLRLLQDRCRSAIPAVLWPYRCIGPAFSSRREQSNSSYTVVNPANGDYLALIEEEPADMVQHKFHMAAQGQKKWQATPLQQRQAILTKFCHLLTKNVNVLAKTTSREMGKPLLQAKSEVRSTVQRVQYFVDNVEKVLAEEVVHSSERLTEKVLYEPLGVVAHISAWNYPYFVAANVFAAALVAGNAVLYKPSEHATLTGIAITSLLHEAGVPDDVFVGVVGRGATGEALASLPGLGGLFFTGSNPTGRHVAKAAASNLVKVQLELGGKDPMFVRRDCPNVAAAAAAVADGAFYNTGQSCCSVERVYVDRSIHDEFVDAFAQTVRGFVMGDPLADRTYIGPLARYQQLGVLKNQFDDALEKGATAVVGGNLSWVGAQGKHNFFPPTVLVHVNHKMAIMQEESFGPIIGIQAVDGDAEALEMMKDTPYGLTAGVYCRDQQTAVDMLKELDVGTGYWNCCDRSVPRLPWSGRKGSGLGSTLAIEGLRAMVRPKAFHLQSPS